MIVLTGSIDPNGDHEVRIEKNGLISYRLTNTGSMQEIVLYGTKEQWAELLDAVHSCIYQLKSMEPKEED